MTPSKRRDGACQAVIICAMSMEYDEDTGTIYLMELLPEEGDSCMIVCVGPGLYQIHRHRFVEGVPPLTLTDEDIDRMKAGTINYH